VRLADVFCVDFRKTNMVKFALSDELGHDARALFEGNTRNDTCRLKQVKFLGATELGEDEIDFAFEGSLSGNVILAMMPIDSGGNTHRLPYEYDVLHCTQYPASRHVCGLKSRNGYLDRKECLVCVAWVSLEEAREKLEISAWGVDSIKLAYSLWVWG
jgi:hypothetical protein